MKKLILAFILGSFSLSVNSQCDITATASQVEIVCGESVDLSAFGSSNGTVVLDEDFDGGGFGPGWSGTPGSTNFTNPCDPGNGTPHAWMDNNTTVPRTLTSAPYDLSGATAGVTICFDLLFAEQGNAAPCEGPDEPDEGVFLQYSTDGGATWIDIHYFDPNGGNDPMLTNWNTWCFTLPPGALTANTLIRWHQTADSGADYDHWGIDNVQIFQNDINAEITWLHDGYSYGVGQPGGVNPNPVTPTTTTTYTAQIVTGTGDVCTADVTVVVLAPTYDVTLNAAPTTICSGDCSTITGTGQIVVDPGGIETYENTELSLISGTPGLPGIPPFIPPTPGDITADVNINVVGLNEPTITAGMVTTVCINDFNIIAGGTTTLANCEIVLTCPSGTQIVLANVGDLSGTSISNMCFQMGAPNVSTGSAPYSGTFAPAEPFDNLVGCDAEGVWNLTISGEITEFTIPLGSFGGWSITFDDPPIFQPVCYQWTPAVGLSTDTDINTTACPTTTTTYDLEVSNCIPGCPTYTESVTITVDPCGGCVPPVMVINPPAAVCAPNSIDLATTIDPTSDPATISYHASLADANADANPIGASVSTSGTYFIRCEDPGDPTCFTVEQVTVTINPEPVITAEASTDITNCAAPDGTVTITANGDNYELFTSAGASVSTNATGSFTGLAAGDYYVEVSLNGCMTTSSTFTIANASAPAAPNALADATYCVGDPMADLTVSGTGGTFNWYSDPGLTTNIGTGGTLTPGTTQGATTYYVTETVAGCESPASTVTITINVCCDLDVSTVVSDETCDGLNDGSVAFTINGSDTYDVLIDMNVEFNDITAGAQNWIGQADGTYAVQVVDINDPACDTTFNITINPGALITITSESSTDITDCVNPDGTFTVTATGATSYELYTAAGGLVATNATGSFTGLNAGDYYVIATDGTCTGQSSTLTINNASAPAAPVAGTDATYCDGDLIADLTATAGSGGTLTWYDDAGLTNVVGGGITFTPNNTVGTTIYYVTETVAGCESPATAITITINPIPAAPAAGTDATYCLGDALADMTATAGSGGTLNWYDDAGLLNNIGTGTTQAPNNTVGATTYYVTESLGACVSTASTVTITINDAPTITSEIATDLTDCTTPNGTITITSNGTSYELFTAAGVSVATNATGAFTGLGAGDYYVVVSDGNCTTTSATLTVSDQTQSSSNTINAQVCQGEVYTFADGDTLTITQAMSEVSILQNSVGCDSVVTENITVLQPVTSVYNASICEGGDYFSPNVNGGSFVNVLQDFTLNTIVPGGAANGCDSLVTEIITVIPAPTLDFGGDITVCYGEEITVTANTNTSITPAWNTGDTTNSITFIATNDTMFIAVVNTPDCGTASDTINITVLSPPDVDAGPDVTIPLGMETDLEVTSSVPGVSFEWMPGTYLTCDDCPNPTAGPQGTITYIVSGTDENGCVGYDTITVVIDGEVSIYIPNIFSPNNDGENDIFKVYGPTWKNYRMEIYNRWGGLIFLSEDPNVEWDGTHYKNGEECPQAVFVYKFWGVSTIGMTFERAGNVMLTR